MAEVLRQMSYWAKPFIAADLAFNLFGFVPSQSNRSWTEELFICGFRLRWRAGRRHVQPDRIGKAEWPRSGVLSPHCAGPDRGPSDQPHRGAPALEPRTLAPYPILPGSLDTLIRCPPKR